MADQDRSLSHSTDNALSSSHSAEAFPSDTVETIRKLKRRWRLGYVRDGQFIGPPELDILLHTIFPRADDWPAIFIVLFFVDTWPLLSLSRALLRGAPIKFRKASFSVDVESAKLTDAFGQGPVSPEIIYRHLILDGASALPGAL